MSGDNSNNSNNTSQINNLIARLRAQHIHIEPSQAQFLLDATGGDADMALALYWEDSVANAARDRERDRHESRPRDGGARNNLFGNEADAPPPPPAHDRERREHRRERRERVRLRNFLRNHERFGEERRESDRDVEMNRARERDEVAVMRNHRDGGEANHEIAQRIAVDPDNHVSISDDEHNFNERFLRRIKDHMKRRKSRGGHNWELDNKKRKISPQNAGKFGSSWADKINALMNDEGEGSNTNNRDAAGEVLKSLMKMSKYIDDGMDAMDTVEKRDSMEYDEKPSNKNAGNINDDVSDDDDEELDAKYAEALNLLDSTAGMPSRLLWGSTIHEQDDNVNSVGHMASNGPSRSEPSNANFQNQKKNNVNDSNSSNRSKRHRSGGDGGDDDGGDSDDNDDDFSSSDDDDSQSLNDHANIPRTWLAAGFVLSSCGSGLVLPTPDETDLARLKSMQSKLFPPGTSTSAAPLPPFHCGGITMLTSLVTALLYSGVTTHGKDINFNNTSRKPFAQLSSTEKKQQYPSRLADALSAILVVASETSVKYRLNLLNEISEKIELYRDSYRDDDDDDSENEEMHDKSREATIKRVMKTRAMLCPVCRWDETGNNQEVALLDRDDLKMQVSFTNRHDLKAYVVANLHSFMAPGGCALFLETVFHIHGRPRMQKLLAALKGNKRKKKFAPFVQCKCESKLKEEWDLYIAEKKTNPFLRQKDWTRPLSNSCVSAELISLLITGKPYADMTGWCAQKFGIGFLSGVIDGDSIFIDEQLKVPPRPVWIVKGATTYFVIWSDDDNHQMDVRNLGRCSYSFNVSTWNCWDDEQLQETYRIMPTRDKNNTDSSTATNQITKADLDQVTIHPDDKLNYDDFRRWRYSFASDSHKETSNSNNTAPAWIPFFRLSDGQKAIVQMKNANSLKLAIWSLWPNASIQEMEEN